MNDLSDEQIGSFREDGVILLKSLLDQEQVAACFNAWRWSTEHPGPLASGLLPGTRNAFQDLCNPYSMPVYQSIIHSSPLPDVARQLWGGSAVWYMYEQVFRKQGSAGRTPWHQDTSYLAVDGEHLIAFWISFESLPQGYGLEFVRGSHRGTLFNTTRFDPADPTLPVFPSATIPKLPNIEADRSHFDIVSWPTDPGDVIAFHTSTLHGGGAVDDTVQERRTLTLRFFGENTLSVVRPGFSGPFYADIKDLTPGAPFRHPRFPLVRARQYSRNPA
jgi:ectoine hydroxylase-related dioxygenase (phytanoyl-CoA dioxygenase family)